MKGDATMKHALILTEKQLTSAIDKLNLMLLSGAISRRSYCRNRDTILDPTKGFIEPSAIATYSNRFII
jgi:hypothetical protein